MKEVDENLPFMRDFDIVFLAISDLRNQVAQLSAIGSFKRNVLVSIPRLSPH